MQFHKILITGGMGFLGQNLVHELLQKYSTEDDQLEIIILDLFENSKLYPDDFNANIKIHTGVNITNFDQLLPYFDNVDLVFHVAAIMKYGRRNKKILREINVIGSKNVLRACEGNNVKTLVHVGSIGMLKYDKHGATSDGSEYLNWDKEGFAYYGYSKFGAVESLLNSEKEGLKIMVGHPGIMLGPGDLKSQPLFRAGRGFKIFVVPSGGTNFIDVRDVANGLINIAQIGVDRASYLLTNHNLALKELIQAIAENKPNKIRIGKIPSFLTPLLSPIVWALEFIMPKSSLLSKEGTIKSFHKRYFDNSQSMAKLGWEPKYTLDETIQSAVEWLISEGKLK